MVSHVKFHRTCYLEDIVKADIWHVREHALVTTANNNFKISLLSEGKCGETLLANFELLVS